MREREVTTRVVDLAAAMRRRGPYRVPAPAEVAVARELAEALAGGDGEAARAVGVRLGLEATAFGEDLLLASDPTGERAWLVVVARPGTAPDAVVEVPHPNADLDTERIGLAVQERRARTLYLQAGAHRLAGAPSWVRERADCPADVSSRRDAPFSRVAAVLAARGLPQVQLHGFADRDGLDVVLSPGAARGGPLLAAVRQRLVAAGERVATEPDPRCDDLLGRLNVQGRAADRAGSAFVHLELSRSLRRDAVRRDAVAEALAGALDGVSCERACGDPGV
ncbi:hypothetical protein GCM10023200_00750 [Actinomycetospora chlora]|uniref:Uncharacterized protein n=1 Tax=Actinomycetospora chlora TaxID=663608 RepID=A0ABP9A2G2_9PSEU